MPPASHQLNLIGIGIETETENNKKKTLKIANKSQSKYCLRKPDQNIKKQDKKKGKKKLNKFMTG